MEGDDLTASEQELFDELPRPPDAKVTTTTLWIVEWLPPGEELTGLSLHEWIEGCRPGWSAYRRCRSKAEFVEAIERAIILAQQIGMAPVLHLEAHGDKNGLVGPDGKGAMEQLTWDELTESAQQSGAWTG